MQRLALAIGILVTAAGLAAAGPGNDSRQPLYARAPAKFQRLPNPLQGDAQAVEFGRRIFDRACAKCHTADKDGYNKGPELHREQIRVAAPGAIFWVIKTGNAAKGMPGFSQLPDKQKWQIVTYLRFLADGDPATEKPSLQ